MSGFSQICLTLSEYAPSPLGITIRAFDHVGSGRFKVENTGCFGRERTQDVDFAPEFKSASKRPESKSCALSAKLEPYPCPCRLSKKRPRIDFATCLKSKNAGAHDSDIRIALFSPSNQETRQNKGRREHQQHEVFHHRDRKIKVKGFRQQFRDHPAGDRHRHQIFES